MSFDVNAVVDRYVKLRDMKAELDRAHKDKVKQIDDALTKLEAALLQHLNASGSESVGTASGTAFKTTKTSRTRSLAIPGQARQQNGRAGIPRGRGRPSAGRVLA